MTAKFVALAALFAAAACQQGTSPAPEYRPEDAGSVDQAMCLLGFSAIPLREVATGHHLVEARINGRSGSFVLDTGANVTVVAEAEAGRFDLSGGAGGFAGGVAAGTAGRANQAGVESFQIGSIAVRQDRVVITDMSQLLGALSKASGQDVAGIIGQDVLTEHRAIIDVAKPMLYLIERDQDPAPVPAETCNGTDEGATADA